LIFFSLSPYCKWIRSYSTRKSNRITSPADFVCWKRNRTLNSPNSLDWFPSTRKTNSNRTKNCQTTQSQIQTHSKTFARYKTEAYYRQCLSTRTFPGCKAKLIHRTVDFTTGACRWTWISRAITTASIWRGRSYHSFPNTTDTVSGVFFQLKILVILFFNQMSIGSSAVVDWWYDREATSSCQSNSRKYQSDVVCMYHSFSFFYYSSKLNSFSISIPNNVRLRKRRRKANPKRKNQSICLFHRRHCLVRQLSSIRTHFLLKQTRKLENNKRKKSIFHVSRWFPWFQRKPNHERRKHRPTNSPMTISNF